MYLCLYFIFFQVVCFSDYAILEYSESGYLGVALNSYAPLVVSVLGFSHGYLGSACVLLSHELVEPYEKSITGLVSGVVAGGGAVVGAICSLVFLADSSWTIAANLPSSLSS